MKALVAALFLSGFSYASFGQDLAAAAVPSVVMNSFRTQFAEAQKTDWEKKGNHYEAEFELGTAERTAVLDASGKILLLKQEIAKTELPAAVADAIKQNYKSYDLEETEKIEYEGKTYYEVELSRFFMDKEAVFTADGKQTTLPL